MSFFVRVTPRARNTRIDRVLDGQLRVRVTAPPVDGAVNEAVVRLLAGELAIATSAVTIERGHSGRVKLLSVEGVTSEQILERWAGLEVGRGDRGGNVTRDG